MLYKKTLPLPRSHVLHCGRIYSERERKPNQRASVWIGRSETRIVASSGRLRLLRCALHSQVRGYVGRRKKFITCNAAFALGLLAVYCFRETERLSGTIGMWNGCSWEWVSNMGERYFVVCFQCTFLYVIPRISNRWEMRVSECPKLVSTTSRKPLPGTSTKKVISRNRKTIRTVTAHHYLNLSWERLR